jgi:hypothetical protein
MRDMDAMNLNDLFTLSSDGNLLNPQAQAKEGPHSERRLETTGDSRSAFDSLTVISPYSV